MFYSRKIPNMKTVLIDSNVFLLLFALCFARITGNGGARTSTKLNNLFIGNHKPNLIAFNSDDGDIDITWDVSVPFFRIPLNHVKENGEASPLLNVNTRGLSIAGILTAILTLAVPLVSKPTLSGMHYRSESQWSRMGDTINEIVLGNNYVTPCIQRIVCTIVSEASHSDNPTSTDKIIDGLSSHKWFKEFTNGTVIQEAVRIGRERNHECGHVYKKCYVTPRILKNMMEQFGIF